MRIISAILLIVALFVCASVALADGPIQSHEGKLFGMTMVSGGPGGDDMGPSENVLFPLFESSPANLALVGISWGDSEKSDPGDKEPVYDWSSFDQQLMMKSAKTKTCVIGLWNGWTDKVKEKDPERYWKLAERWVTAACKHANMKGVKYFQVAGNEYDLLGRGDWAQMYVEPVKHIYVAAKKASKENVIIAGNLSYGGDDVVQALYDAGIKEYFDVLDIHAYSNDPKTGCSMWQIVAAHRAMERNGDGNKQIFLGEGWGPMRALPTVSRKSDKDPISDKEIHDMRWFVENGYRNILTERDIYDPSWVLGARFFTMNDNYGQAKWKPRAKFVDENGDGKYDYLTIDGYRFPPDFDVEPRYFNGGIVDYNGKSKGDILENFLPKLPEHTFEAKLTADGPAFNYVTGTPYKLALTVKNQSGNEWKLDNFNVSWYSFQKGDLPIEVKPDGEAPKTLASGAEAVASFIVTLPKEAANREIILVGELTYTVGDKQHFTDCWLTIVPSPKFEITMLPARMVLGPGEPGKLGMSIINHSEQPYAGKVTLKASQGLSITPAETATNIDSHGLEAFVATITKDKSVGPGHYAVFVNLGDQGKDWAAIDVPVLVEKAKGKITADGKLDDWKNTAKVAIGSPAVADAMFAYDDANFYAAFEVSDDKHIQEQDLGNIWRDDCLQIAVDPLLDGARVATGGYRDDDYEFGFAAMKTGPTVSCSKAGNGKPIGVVKNIKFAFKHEGSKSYYEITFPWSELAPFKPAKDAQFAMGVLINDNDGKGRQFTEWGGGISDAKDPRLFIPFILTQ